jgi:hypothetical protein
MINERILPMKKFYTRNELQEATKAAGSNPQGGQAPFDPTGHVAANFQFNGPGLIDIFNMEGNPNEHDLSTGINDCETIYPCFDEEGRGKCTHTPSIVGRLKPLPVPVPNPTPTSPTATPEAEGGGGRLPAFINFCPNLLDHLPKCFDSVNTVACGCSIPNCKKAEEFWTTLDRNKDGLATLDDLDALRNNFAMPGFPPLSEDKNPVGSVALAGSFELLNQIFATTQAAVGRRLDGTLKPGLNRDQFFALNINRRFPTTYKFPGGCFVDPNEKVNQNNYASPGFEQAWVVTRVATGALPLICTDANNGVSMLTGPVASGISTAKVAVFGSGIGYVDFGNCNNKGVSVLSVGGKDIANAYQQVVSKVVTFPYTDGEILMITATEGAIARVNFVSFNGTLVNKPVLHGGVPCPAPGAAPAPTPVAANPCAPTPRKYGSQAPATVQQSFQMPLMVLLVVTFVGSVVVVFARRCNARITNLAAFTAVANMEANNIEGGEE